MQAPVLPLPAPMGTQLGAGAVFLLVCRPVLAAAGGRHGVLSRAEDPLCLLLSSTPSPSLVEEVETDLNWELRIHVM